VTVTQFMESDTGHKIVTHVTVTVTQSCNIEKNIKGSGINNVYRLVYSI